MKDQIYNGHVLRRECVFCQYHPSNAAGNTVGTQPTDVQQLKAKIASVVSEMEFCQPSLYPVYWSEYVNKLRQLSAV